MTAVALPPALVLAGGLGTRLASVVPDLPKPMAPVAGRPFLEHVLRRLAQQGVAEAILCVGYKRDVIQAHFGTQFGGLQLRYSNEDQALGTGGAIRLAFDRFALRSALTLNGDTWCEAPLSDFVIFHRARAAQVSVVLTPVADSARFGAVETDADGRIQRFSEKPSSPGEAWVNAGVYLVEAAALQLAPAVPRFSFEAELMPACAAQGQAFGFRCQANFIDIGVPSDYQRAQELFASSDA